jgi:hypothetical protein
MKFLTFILVIITLSFIRMGVAITYNDLYVVCDSRWRDLYITKKSIGNGNGYVPAAAMALALQKVNCGSALCNAASLHDFMGRRGGFGQKNGLDYVDEQVISQLGVQVINVNPKTLSKYINDGYTCAISVNNRVHYLTAYAAHPNGVEVKDTACVFGEVSESIQYPSNRLKGARYEEIKYADCFKKA